ncbi:MAG: zinc ABC transporter substrate-binding protein [Rhodopseudomonas palustris]|nr:zinc ABC transporter substrate-binding protein [Rhodopseudomonas palustris]
MVVASQGIKPPGADADTTKDTHGKAHAHDAPFDPHAWQSVANVKVYVGNIRDALAAADPDGAALYAANAADYLRQARRARRSRSRPRSPAIPRRSAAR